MSYCECTSFVNMKNSKHVNNSVADILLLVCNLYLDDHCSDRSDLTLLLDNAPCHRSQIVIKFLKDNGLKYYGFGGHPINQRGGFPPNSPDLNPIEHIWSVLQERVALTYPKFIHELKEAILEQWFGKKNYS